MDYSFHLSDDEPNKQASPGNALPAEHTGCPACKARNASDAVQCGRCGATLSPAAPHTNYVHPLDRLRPPPLAPADAHGLGPKDAIGTLFPYSILSNRKADHLTRPGDAGHPTETTLVNPHPFNDMPIMPEPAFPLGPDPVRRRHQNRKLLVGLVAVATASAAFALYDLMQTGQKANPAYRAGAPAAEGRVRPAPGASVILTPDDAPEIAAPATHDKQEMEKPAPASATGKPCPAAAAAMGLCDALTR